MNPITILSGFSLQTKVLLVIGFFIAGFATGYKVSGAFKKADEGRSIKTQLKTADAIAHDTKKQVKEIQDKLVETKIIYRTIREKIQDENDTRICFADHNALGLWNDAIAGKDQDRSIATGKTSEAYSIVATVEQVLTNAVDNFETCNTNSIKHNALIDQVEALDGKMCVCSE